MPRARDTAAGITLLEMLVVLAVLVLLAGALTVGYARLPGTALKREAVKIAAALRSGYDRATASGAHHRLILDMAAGTFHLERCEGRVQMRKSRDLQEEAERKKEEAEKAQRLANAQSSGDVLGSMTRNAGQMIGASAQCAPVDGPMGKAIELGGHPKVSFSKIIVAHLEDPAVTGEVTINFFPMGTAERAVIILGVGEEEYFSIGVHPLSGRIEMRVGEWRDVEETVREDAEGTETVK